MTSDLKFTYIQSITPGLKNVNVQFIVLEVGTPRQTKDGQEVRTLRVADASGSVDLAVWNELGECLSPGDICRLRNGYSVVRKGCVSVSCGKQGELVKIGEFTMVYSETPNISEFNASLLQDTGTNPRKRSPPANDEDNNEEDPRNNKGSDGNGPQIKQAKKNGNSVSAGSNGSSNTSRNASRLNFPTTTCTSSTTSTSALTESVPYSANCDQGTDSGNQKAGYRRLESWKKTETHNTQNHASYESTKVETSSSRSPVPRIPSLFRPQSFNPQFLPPPPPMPPSFVPRFPGPGPFFPLASRGPNYPMTPNLLPGVRGSVF